MPKVTKSPWQQSIYIESDSPISGGIKVWQLLKFAQTLQGHEIGMDERVECHHDHNTRHLTHLSVRETREMPIADAQDPEASE